VNEEALAHWELLRQKQKTKKLYTILPVHKSEYHDFVAASIFATG
jgi:hypothetical protein